MKFIQTDQAPQAIGPYVQGRISNGFLFASGQIALDPKTGVLVGETIEEQTKQVLKNIKGLLNAANTDEEHVIKTTCFLKNMDDFEAFNQIYATMFESDFPSRSTVEVARLPKNALIEIEVIAEVG